MRCLVGVAVAIGLIMGASQARAEAPIEAYGKLPNIEANLFEISPLGDRLAFVAGSPTGRQLFVSDLAGKVLMTYPVGKAKLFDLSWAGNDHVILAAGKTIDTSVLFAGDKHEFEQDLVVSLISHRVYPLFFANKAIVPGVYGHYGVIERAGRTYALVGGVTMEFDRDSTAAVGGDYRLTHGWPDLYKVDLESGVTERVAGGSVRVESWAVGPDGSVLGHSEYSEKTGDWWLYADPLDKQVLYHTVNPLNEVVLAGVGRRPGTLILTGNGMPVTEIDPAKPNEKVELFGQYNNRAGLLHSGDNLLVGLIVNDDRPYAIFTDPALQAKFDAAKKPFAKETVKYISADRAWNKWLLLTEGDGDSGTYYLVDLAAHKAEVVGTEYPEIDATDVGPSKIVHYKAADGTEMEGILTTPNGKDPKGLPLVVLPHGGPAARDHLGFDWWAQAFAHRGYAVFQPNYRGSTGFGLEFRDAGFGQWGRKMQTDISDGVAELARQGVVDPKRACIVGASYGGYAALAGVTVQHGLYRCAVSVAGVADLNAMLKWESDNAATSNSASSRFWRRFMGATSDGDPALREISPQALARNADAPILLVHGTDDTVVPITQSRDMARALRAAGKPVELVEIEHEDHWETNESARIQTLLASIAFVEKYNPAH